MIGNYFFIISGIIIAAIITVRFAVLHLQNTKHRGTPEKPSCGVGHHDVCFPDEGSAPRDRQLLH